MANAARELFNLQDDIAESKNVIAENAKVAEELADLLRKFSAGDQPSKKAAKE